MKIAAALCWFDEPVAFLDRCVRSLEGVVDHLVAYDGAWDLFPGGTFQSPPEQRAALAAAASEVGLPVVDWLPTGIWPSQVEKRSALMHHARQLGEWILVIDADEWIDRADPDVLRWVLRETEHDVAEVAFRKTTVGDGVSHPARIRRLYRSSALAGVELAHNGYRTADGRWLHGDRAYVSVEPAESGAAEHLRMLHARNSRGAERQAASREYHRARHRGRVEQWRR